MISAQVIEKRMDWNDFLEPHEVWPTLHPPQSAAEPGSLRDYGVEQWDTCLVVFLHNTTDPMERLCLHLRLCV